MIKISSLLLLFLVTASSLSQNVTNKDIIGVYSQTNSNPEGGETLIVFPDNTYIIVYFGGFQKGKWSFAGNKLRLVNENEPAFVLYGRKLKSLGNHTKINFSVDPDNQASVSLNPKSIHNLKPVFNSNPNCFAPEYLITQESSLNQLQAAQFLEEDIHTAQKQGFTADFYDYKNLDAFNDFILVNLPYEYTAVSVMEATYNNNLLSIDHLEESMRKKPLNSIDAEELEYIKTLATQKILPEILEYGNEFFPYVEKPNSEDFIHFQRIEPSQVSSEKNITLEKESWFIATCGEED